MMRLWRRASGWYWLAVVILSAAVAYGLYQIVDLQERATAQAERADRLEAALEGVTLPLSWTFDVGDRLIVCSRAVDHVDEPLYRCDQQPIGD